MINLTVSCLVLVYSAPQTEDISFCFGMSKSKNKVQREDSPAPYPTAAHPLLSGVFVHSMAGAAAVRYFFSDAQPCLCLDSMASRSLSAKSKMDVAFCRNFRGRRNWKKLKSMNLGTSFLDTWSAKRLSSYGGGSTKKKKVHHLRIVGELGGQYEEGFDDVKDEIINYVTYKAVKTVLHQLYEMNPPQYMWFHNFVADNVPNTGKRFLQTLAKENQDLAERVMITRLHLYGKWIKVCDHAEIYKDISDQNLELMREQLMETVIWLTDETNTEKTD